MKFHRYLKLIITSSILYSCSHHSTPTITPTIPSIPEIKTDTPTTEATIVKPIEIKNYDLEFQNKLRDVWGSYFKENYNESRSLDIYVVTNRNLKTKQFGCSDEHFGINLEKANKNYYGVCRISVPKNHSTSEILFSPDGKGSTHKFYKIVSEKEIIPDTLFDFVKRTKRTPLIFIHGFNVKYQEALLRVSQITYDLKYQGPVILFTWPSGAGDGFLDDTLLTKTYEQNMYGAQNSIELFKKIISEFYLHEIPINIMVHSMGHQVVIPAIKQLGLNFKDHLELPEKKIINELIMNAPDFDRDDFIKNVDDVKYVTKRMTLYCSNNDKALVASNKINKSERLGSCSNIDDIDTINVSSIDSTTIGHSYYASRDVITDVFQVLLGLDAEKRIFIKKSDKNANEKFQLRN
jgi:esterase/lipase superfamily enzyme